MCSGFFGFTESYYNEKDFSISLKIAENVKPELKDIKGGIVPHHLLADGMIATIDFSHYLAPDKADKMDEITLKAVKDRDLNARISKQHSESTTSYFTMLFYK